MNYRDPDRYRPLAAEYALGTLRGGARRRFEQLLVVDSAIRREVELWQQHWQALIDALPEQAPPARVWHRLRRQLVVYPRHRRPVSDNWWNSLDFWRGWGLLATAASLLLGLYLVLQSPGTPPSIPEYTAVLADSEDRLAWLVRFEPVDNRLVLEALRPQPVAAENSYELWLLPDQSAAPVSLGLIAADGETTLSLPDPLAGQLSSAQGLAVSREPVGGSTTGAPTGPVLYQSVLIPAS